jgi:hypothetical protein
MSLALSFPFKFTSLGRDDGTAVIEMATLSLRLIGSLSTGQCFGQLCSFGTGVNLASPNAKTHAITQWRRSDPCDQQSAPHQLDLLRSVRRQLFLTNVNCPSHTSQYRTCERKQKSNRSILMKNRFNAQDGDQKVFANLQISFVLWRYTH